MSAAFSTVSRLTKVVQNEIAKDTAQASLHSQQEIVTKDHPSPLFGSYNESWTELFGEAATSELLSKIRSIGFCGGLQGSRFRSVCWRVLLQALPAVPKQWPSTLKKHRDHYGELKEKYSTDPRDAGQGVDWATNNPLSSAEDNPWNRFFSDNELRACIIQDVDRTFPELEYFQSQGVRHMMSDILFVYARLCPYISYKQGMHEILGPLIFVLFFDQQAYAHAAEVGGLEGLAADDQQILKTLMNENFLEHDAFHMFSQIMRIIQPWYYSPADHNKSFDTPEGMPFARPQDMGPTSSLVRKLNWIGDHLLAACDPDLSRHLATLDIAPQIYGIRWLRLLFGREFPIQDLLCLWDAIFADGPPFVLVDHIFVAMLVFIRDLLLGCDYTGCLHYLMRYPPVADVHNLLALSLHFRFPQTYAKPACAYQKYSHITVSGRPHPNVQRKGSPPPNSDGQSGLKSRKTLGISGNLVKRLDGERVSIGETLSKLSLTDNAKKAGGSLSAFVPVQRAGSERKTRKPMKIARPLSKSVANSPGSSARVSPEPEVELLKEQVSALQTRLNEVEATSQYAADRLSSAADVFADALCNADVSADHGSYRTVTELRQLADMLRGSLRIAPPEPKQPVMNTPVEIGHDAVRTIASGTDSSATPPVLHNPTYGLSTKGKQPTLVGAGDACLSPDTEFARTLTVSLGEENELRDLSGH